MNFEKYYLLDTNILLENASNIFKLSDSGNNLLILTETVLDEIDSKKSGFEEINFQAREFARILENSKVHDSFCFEDKKIIRVNIENSKTIIDIISKEEYKASSKNISLNILNDRKILEIASEIKEFYTKDIIFISMDIMARTRALSLDIKTEALHGKELDKLDFKFIKEIEINFEDLESLNNQDIINFDEEYSYNNFSYCFKVKSSDQVILASIVNEKIVLLDEVEIRNQIITPLNKEQLFFSNAIINHFYNVLIVEAKAGSGKTLLALSGALKLVRQKEFQKIIYIRNSIESLDKGEDVGYLPGLEEKFAIYNHPLMDSLDYIIRSEHKRKRNKRSDVPYNPLDDSEVTARVEQMISNYGIETMWVGEMRGRTLSNSFIIIDEAQNMSNKTMQMVLSRIDNSCKVVILGSNKQIDNFYVNRYTNALTTLLKSTQAENHLVNIFAIKLEKVLRGPITEWAEDIFSK
ncbi:phosphate starvation-inducible protein PhoH [Aliarcobacter trophiarum LMG 25534]|uniref:PhoH-like protein n=1 Tax=Aliarcobacter trophiarum LMG 25534 TaxID=1032241 RepID=A0AAD0QHR7_9BACT|nr:PhoH family protein [Aliarcobacter trophiarum]AXK47936.1 putative ribonuclease, YlaK/PhoH family [Aliarcobacter trophiarum LMG 25534]RXI28143.1 phosphate starvation-inducible protein PhoH [Aliarcobacter trophiarum]RXJ92403.1 phosphate starvation-inducible protein PhoH [Aliarcobacter trophiarum LMG 25534]